ncbi:MAG: hypothetical protein RL766_2124, partial [Bacteroidota bacterium]
MTTEKLFKPFSGYQAVSLAFVLLVMGVIALFNSKLESNISFTLIGMGIGLILTAIIVGLGLMIVDPNYAVVLTFFGKYVGTVKENGLQFVNPLYTKLKVSLRSQSMESTRLKVNDKLGNPIEISAVVVFQISDT